MKRTIAILTSISMLLCSVPAFPVTARQPSKETYFLVADKNDNRAILFDLVKEKGNPYGYNSYEISDWSTGEGRYTAASADWDVGDILLYTGGYSYTELPPPASNYFIMKEDGSFEEVGVLPDTLQDAVQKDENGCFLYKGDDDATAALVACLKEPEPTEATELPGYPDCLPELMNLTTEATEQTDPTEPATITMEEDVPVFVHPRYVVLDKTESFLYLIRFPFEATDREFHSNGIYLPTYVLHNEGVFTETFEQADPGDMLELRDGDLDSTEMSCWNYFILPSDPEDVGHFEWVGNLLGEEAYADNVTEWHSEKHLVFTSKEGSRYVVVANENDYPSFVPENELTEMPTDPTEESVTWTEPVTTARFRIWVVDAETGEPLAGVRIGNWVSDGSGAPYEGTYELYNGSYRFSVGEVPEGYVDPDLVNYGSGHYEVCGLENVELTFRIPRDPAATEPTMPDPLPDPTYYKQEYVVLDKTDSALYLLEYPCNVTTAAYEDNGANLPTYILKDDDPLFRSVIEEAEWGDIIEYTGTSLISTCLNCWNTLGRDGTPPDDETFVKKGSLLTDNDHVTKVDGETYLAFTSSDQARYLVIRKNGRPSFVPETDLTTSAEPTTRQFVVLDKAFYPENTQWHPPIQAHTNLYVLEIPFEGADKDFNNNGDLLPVYTITDTKDTLFAPLCAEAEIGDVITYYGTTLSDYGKWEPMWESMYREPDVKGNYAAEDTFTVTGSFFTDEQYADYLTEWHGEKHLVLTSVEGTRYVVFTAAYEYPSFFPERYLNDFGDLNHDGIHNASDAAMILVQAALMGAQDATFLDPRMVEARIIGDLNGDGFSDASDAALMLIYAAYCGAQREAPADLQSYLYELNDTVKRVTIGYREGLSSEHVTKELLTSPAELETYFTETVTPQNINMTDCLVQRDSAEVLAEIMAAYPAAFFETHNLAVFCADEANHNNRQEVRQIETSDGGVTITMHHLDINGEPVEGFYAVLVAVDKSITEVSQITVNETHSRYTG